MAKVLVVEDDRSLRLAFQDVLRRGGHEVDVVGTSADAGTRIAGGDVDVVVTDLQLPGHGYEVLAAARASGIPAIVVTGYDRAGGEDSAYGRGASGYLRKPVSGVELREAVRSALGDRE